MIDLFNGLFNKINSKNNFFIKTGYTARASPEYFVDNMEGIIHQPDVYPLASFLGVRFNCKYIIDIGCGTGNKLSQMHPQFEIIGIDFGVNIKECRNRHSFGTWLEYDLDTIKDINLPPEIVEKSVIICSDVIEHLKNPSNILSIIKRLMNKSPVCLISTPERDLVRGIDDMGPPANPSHIREWNESELKRLLDHHRFNVEFLGLTVNNDHDLQKRTILAVIGNNKKLDISPKNLKDFKVVAIMTAYNEEDIIYDSVITLKNQGIDVYVIDNWSTDSTYKIIKQLESEGTLLGSERYPADTPPQYYEWKKLLNRVEQLSQTIDADWFIHHDVDEIRVSPWQGLSLKEGIYLVDQMGFNAIDHTVIVFKPTDNGFSNHDYYGDYFTSFEFGKRPGHFSQIKAWKNLGEPISLSSSGGHEISFDGRKIFPFKFLLKHYPIRSQTHGEKKIFSDRKPRWSPEERKNGWHIQYDQFDYGCSFIANPKESLNYDEEAFNRIYLVERLSGVGIIR